MLGFRWVSALGSGAGNGACAELRKTGENGDHLGPAPTRLPSCFSHRRPGAASLLSGSGGVESKLNELVPEATLVALVAMIALETRRQRRGEAMSCAAYACRF